MKKVLLLIACLAVAFIFISGIMPAPSAEAAGEVHKRIVNGIEEYECLLLNETNWYVIILIDGKRIGSLLPGGNNPNVLNGSGMRIWLSLGKHEFLAYAHKTQNDIAKNTLVSETPKITFDISGYVDKERQPNGAYRLPAISIDESAFIVRPK